MYFYATLLTSCALLMIISDFLGPTARESILSVAPDGFKTVLGAIIGTLSAISGSSK